MPKKLAPRGNAAPPVQPNVASAKIAKQPRKKAAAQVAEDPTQGNVVFVRNIRAIECRFTLSTGLRVELDPRGQRGDIATVPADQQWDPIFTANHDLLFEVIDSATAADAISKQQTNASHRGNPLLEMLTDENGKPYDQRNIRVDPAFERQGFTVAQLQAGADGRFTEGNVEVVREPRVAAGPQTVAVPGSPGHPATERMQSVPSGVDPAEYHEFLLWKQYREEMANQPAPEEIRDSLSVSIEEPVEIVDEDAS